jgi:hypothetical protein
MRFWKFASRHIFIVLVALVLSSCGGGSGTGNVRLTNAPGPGYWVSTSDLGQFQVSELAQSNPIARSSNIIYGVKAYRLVYTSSDGYGNPINASALVAIPQKSGGSLSPILSLQHGTTAKDAEAPSNHATASEPAIGFAAIGVHVIAPDYVGYAASKGSLHPYLLAAPSAAVVNDAITAFGYWAQSNAINHNGQLFMAGYSEGAYATLAAHRALQNSSIPMARYLKGVIAGAGPYNVELTLNDLLDKIRRDSPLLGALINPGFLKFLSGSVRKEVRNRLLDAVLGSGADVEFQGTFLDYYLGDDVESLRSLCNVFDWKPQVSVALFHGRDDVTVDYKNATSALEAMRLQGAGDLVSLTECKAMPADHLTCVAPFYQFLLSWLQSHATAI